MADSDKPQFSSLEQELAHWHSLATKYKDSYECVKEELEEFQTSSHELEFELESQLTRAENKNKELTVTNSKLQTEVENLKEKLEKLQLSSYRQVSELETELTTVQSYGDRLQKYIRELEQTNDDLERAKRAAVVSLEDFEARLNQAIERNAFLESELDEKENLVVCVQRLKDEARDLRHELAVHHKSDDEVKSDGEKENLDIGKKRSSINFPTQNQDILQGSSTGDATNANKVEIGTANVVDNCMPNSEDMSRQRIASSTPVRNSSFMMASPINTSTRISALNIVSDLLRKVGALESKLNSCRSATYNQPQPGTRNRERNSPNSPSNSPSSKRVSVRNSSSLGQAGYVQITV